MHRYDEKWHGIESCMLTASYHSVSGRHQKLLNAVADTVEWCAHKEGVSNIYHHLDDYAIVGPPHSDLCHQDVHKLKQICQDLGIPLAPEKEEGPCTRLTLPGIENRH